MHLRRLNFETTLYILALSLAIGLRFYNLGAAPLSESEAVWALQALQVAHPDVYTQLLVIGPQPAYVFLTGAAFALLGASDFAARMWPATAGALLVLLPLFFRRELGRTAALIMAFGLALDPGLVTVSRQAGGPMMALSFGLLALGFWYVRRTTISGVSGGLALLSGPAIINGALGPGLSWIALRYGRRSDRPTNIPSPTGETEQSETGSSSHPLKTALQRDLRDALISTGITILLVGTCFSLYPQGLTAWFNTLPTYLGGWTTSSGIPALQLIAALIFYQPFAMLLALVAIGRWLINQSMNHQPGPSPLFFPLMWFFISLMLALVYPARQVSDLVWTLTPLWAIAAMELSFFFSRKRVNAVSLLLAALIIILAGLFWNTMIATGQMEPISGIPWVGVQAAVLIGILSLGALTTLLVGLGWSWDSSRSGLVWGLSGAFAIYSLAALWGATQLRSNQPQELWHTPPGSGQETLMLGTLRDLSNWESGFPQYVDMVSTVESASLRWALRDYLNLRFVSQPTPEDLPDVIITPLEADAPALTAAYRGQDFVWWVYPGWEGVLPADLGSWLTFRQAPLVNEYIILWARTDIFPGGALEPLIQKQEIE